MPAIWWAFKERHFVLRFHAFVEMKLERLSLEDVAHTGAESELLETYPDRAEGHTKLLLAKLGSRPIHVVVNVQEFHDDPSYPIAIVTLYEPEPPYWVDERTRGTS